MAYPAGESCSPVDMPWPSYNPTRGWETGTVLVSTSEPDDSVDYVLSLSFAANQFGPWGMRGTSNVSWQTALPGGV